MDNIKVLIDKFLDAETTLEEEQELYDFFAQEDIPEELRQYQDMFRDYACMETAGQDSVSEPVDKDAKSDITTRPRTIELKPKIRRWQFVSIAASVVLVFSLGIGYMLHSNANYAVAYVNGEKTNDEAVALSVGCDAVSDILSNEDNASEELYDIFNPE